MTRKLYSELSTLLQARSNSNDKRVRNGEEETESTRNATDWYFTHTAKIDALVREHMPNGSGFDSGTQMDLVSSHAEKLVFLTSFHHMNDAGMYDGWTEHTVTVTPSFQGFNIRISGRDRNEIKDMIHEQFSYALDTITDNRCAVCDVAGPEHGHYSITDASTHKFVSKQ